MGPRASFHLTELYTALIKETFDEQLEEAVSACPETCFAQLPVGRDKLSNHSADLLKAMDTSRARVPVFELCMVGQAWQGEEETQLAVVFFGRAEFLQAVEAPYCLLHGELQL